MARGQDAAPNLSTVREQPTYTITPHDRHWAVRDPGGELVCLTV